MKQTKRSLLMSALSLLLCFSMLIGTTWAWFTDSVSSESNVIKSGNLDLDVQYTLDGKTWNDLDGAEDLFQKGLWEPGHTEVVALKITNKGSLALKYAASMNIMKETVGKNKDGGDIVLSDILTVSTLTQQANQVGDIAVMLAFAGENAGGLAYNATVAFKSGNVLQADQELTPGDAHYVIVKVDMPEIVGNEANHDGVNLPKIEFGINVVATQSSYESDSFGTDYDDGLTFDDLADTNVLASSTKTLSVGADSIDFALYAKGTRIAKINVPASAIADTSKPVKVTIAGIEPSEEAIVDENTQAYAYDIKVTNLKSGLTGDQLVTVVVAAPNALAAMKAYHNGELIEDAIYDEVEGTITFKTASFSPYDFTSKIEEVSNLEQLRAALQKDGTTAKLTENINVNLTKDNGAARDINHAYVGTNNTYYNGVMINGKNVGLDLNGHSITAFCGNDRIGNSDVGALFFVGEKGSLNITNTGAVDTGFIKMESSIYAVWAPFDSPSYVDIYGGAFIADAYAGDEIGTAYDANGNPDPVNGTMKNENTNRALIYAGFGGNINVYGGYFLYNNTPNDVKNRNNGAFNAKDFYEGSTPLLTIHEGVMLINKEYRQNPKNTSTPNGSFDNYSVKLEGEGAEPYETDDDLLVINQVTLAEPVKIDGASYATWYQVQRTYYELIFMGNDGMTELARVNIPFTQGEVDVAKEYEKAGGATIPDFSHWVNTGADEVTKIPADNTKHVTLYAALVSNFTARYLDENGNVLAAVSFTNESALDVIKDVMPDDPASGSQYLTFDHWVVRNEDGTNTDLDKYNPQNAQGDITIYPYYSVKQGEGMIGLTGKDIDGDGIFDEYTVEAVSGLSGTIEIPGDINGAPVKVITDLSSDGLNSSITAVIIKDGVETINSNAFAMTSALKEVTIPASVTSVGSNAFANTLGGGFAELVGGGKVVTITYDGTWRNWIDNVCASGWDGGLAKGSSVICKDENGNSVTYKKTSYSINSGENYWNKQ